MFVRWFVIAVMRSFDHVTLLAVDTVSAPAAAAASLLYCVRASME